MKRMNRFEKNTKIIFVVFCGLFISLIAYLTYFTVIQRDMLIQSSYNRRIWEQEEKVLRGTIYDAKGRPLADTIIENNTKTRIYPGGEAFGPILGYSDRKLGRAGLEDVYNSELLGLSEQDPMVILRRKILGVSDRGNDIYLTIDSDLQKLAYERFRGKKGAVVAINPKNGAILALVSSPGFDSSSVKQNWDNLTQNPDKPLINRATQGLYPPGSAFKIITLAAALANKPEIETKVYYTPGYVKVNGRVIRDYEGLWAGNFDLKNAFRHSSNSVFIQIAQEIDYDALFQMAEAFGFNSRLNTDFSVAESSFPRLSVMNAEVELAENAIGQGKVLATPLQMARVAAIVANGGEDVIPYILEKIVSPTGAVEKHEAVKEKNRVMDASIAQKVTDLMIDVVNNGTGSPAWIRGVSVAGKTGSAENPHGAAHAWFVAFAPAEDPEIAVAVVVENAGSGGKNAGPIARDIILRYINGQK